MPDGGGLGLLCCCSDRPNMVRFLLALSTPRLLPGWPRPPPPPGPVRLSLLLLLPLTLLVLLFFFDLEGDAAQMAWSDESRVSAFDTDLGLTLLGVGPTLTDVVRALM